MESKAINWKDRIVSFGRKPASEFTANPKNPRTHPQAQRDALGGSLKTLGWISPVIENVHTGYLIDGHERIWQALANNDSSVPFVAVDLSPEEEAQALLSLDFIAAMAETDKTNMDELLRSFNSDDNQVQAFLAGLAERERLAFAGGTAQGCDFDPPGKERV